MVILMAMSVIICHTSLVFAGFVLNHVQATIAKKIKAVL